MIRLDNVCRLYPARAQAPGGMIRALDDFSLHVEPGEWIAVMGPSGSGKSTLVNLIGCLDRPSSGEIWLDGENVAGLKVLGQIHQQTRFGSLEVAGGARQESPAAEREQAQELKGGETRALELIGSGRIGPAVFRSVLQTQARGVDDLSGTALQEPGRARPLFGAGETSLEDLFQPLG